MVQSLPSAGPGLHAQAVRQVWWARYDSLTVAAELAQQYIDQAGDDELLKLRMQLLMARMGPQAAPRPTAISPSPPCCWPGATRRVT